MRVGSSRWVPDPNISGGEGLPMEVMCKQGPKGWGIIHGKGKERGGEKSFRDRGTSMRKGRAKQEKCLEQSSGWENGRRGGGKSQG